VADIVDPLGGSYFVETLTRDMVAGAYRYFDAIDGMGGMVRAIERGYPQREIAESAYRAQQAVEKKDDIIVGVNEFVMEEEPAIPILHIDESVAETQIARLARLRHERDGDGVKRALDRLRRAASGTDNTMYALLECVRAYATIGEMCDALRDVWGEWEEEPVI
jgi:methylmalonyl-CoA mutase N-terminal domain/subunit